MIVFLIYITGVLVVAIGSIVYFVVDNPEKFNPIDDVLLGLMTGLFWPIIIGTSMCFALVLLIIWPFVLMGSKLQDKLTQ